MTNESRPCTDIQAAHCGWCGAKQAHVHVTKALDGTSRYHVECAQCGARGECGHKFMSAAIMQWELYTNRNNS
jgi:transcription elongation factor Elf1